MPRIKCDFPNCKCKINIIDEIIATCRCGKTYCKKHRLPEKHECTFCYKIDKDEFIKQNRCVATSVINKL